MAAPGATDGAARLARLAAALWSAVVVGALAVGALAPARWGAALADGGPACPWRLVTGLRCPFCGLTHATVALGGGDLAGALAHHPLAPLALALALGPAVVVALGRGPWLARGARPWLLLAAAIALWVGQLALR